MVALFVALPDCVLAAPDLTCRHLWNRVQGRLLRLDRLTSCVCTDHGETGKVPLRCLPLQGGVGFMPWFNPWGSPQRGKGFRYWLVKKWQMCTTGLEQMQQAFRRKWGQILRAGKAGVPFLVPLPPLVFTFMSHKGPHFLGTFSLSPKSVCEILGRGSGIVLRIILNPL